MKSENQEQLWKLLKEVEEGKIVDEDAYKKLLKNLESKTTANDKIIYTTIHILGEAKYFKARKVIEKFLKHKNASLRYIALNALCIHWGLKNHAKTCLEFIEHEKDADNRRLAVSCIGGLYFGKKDKKILQILLKLLNSNKESSEIRETAYNSVLDLMGVPYNKRPYLGREFDLEKDINWNLINSLEKEEER